MAYNINALLSFTSKGVDQTLKKSSGAFKTMSNAGQKLSAGISQASMGIAAIGVPASIATAGFVSAANVAADFEKQMSIVKSLAQGSTEEFTAMENEAKRLGATTAFSANQAAQGLEFLALAGFSAKDSTEVLSTVLNTAAAGTLDLGRASDIVTDSMSALTLAFDKNAPAVAKATKLSDMMALAQARSNTNIEQLGEAIKFGGGTLAAFGVPLDQILASMGKLADAGLKGSTGGTALVNMFSKLAKPTSTAISLMEDAGISFDEIQASLKNPIKLLPKLQKIIGNVDPDGRGAAGIELFGLRGVKAFHALNAAGPKALEKLTGQLAGASDMTDEYGNRLGAAAVIAKKRTENFKGQIISLQSAYEGLNIEIGNLLIKGEDSALPVLKMIVKGVQDITAAFQVASGNVSAFGKPLEELTPTQLSLIEFAIGFKEGVAEVFTTAKNTFIKVKEWLTGVLGVEKDGTKEFGKMIAKIIGFGAIAGPILVAIAGGLFILGPIIGTIANVFGMVGGAIAMVGKIWTGVSFLIANHAMIITKVVSGIGQAIGFVKGAVSLLWTIMTAKITLVLGAFALLGAGIYGVVKRWDNVKEAFAKGFIPGMIELAKSFALGIYDMLKWPIDKAVEYYKKVKGFFGFGDDEDKKDAQKKELSMEERKLEILKSINKEEEKNAAIKPAIPKEFIAPEPGVIPIELEPKKLEQDQINNILPFKQEPIEPIKQTIPLEREIVEEPIKKTLPIEKRVEEPVKKALPIEKKVEEQPTAKILPFQPEKLPMMAEMQPQNKTIEDLNQEILKQKRLAQPMSTDQSALQPQSSQSIFNNLSQQSQKIEVNSNVRLEVDGRELARAVARNTIDNNERLGIKNNAGEKRKMLERGAISK